MTSGVQHLYDDADRDETGDLVVERELQTRSGTTVTETINLTALFTAGDRTSGDVSLLEIEAALVAAGHDLDNPARPASADVAERLHARLDEDVRPAWEVVG